MAPQITPFTLGDRPANSGESVSATCSVTVGDQPLQILWYFNGKILNPHIDSSNILISTKRRRSLLEIEDVTAEHAGEYTCTVSNEAGSTSYSTALVVNGTNLSLIIARTRIILSFPNPQAL